MAVILPAVPPAHADDTGSLADLVDVAAQRLQAADPVAASKWLNGGPITDPARVRQVLADVAAAAESAGVPSSYATAVFTDQINATEAIKYSRFAEIARGLPILNGPGCVATLASAKDSVALQRALDPLYRQALDTATRSYCG
jgi:chorismate mutase